MAQKLGEWGLKKKITVNKLKKVGGIYFRPNKSGTKIASGLQRGAILKKTLIEVAKGKTPYAFNRELQFKYGIAGSQANKRKDIIGLVQGEKKNGLTQEQIKRNLNRAKRERINEAEILDKNENYNKPCIGISNIKSRGFTEKSASNIKETGIAPGFAGNYKNSKLPDNSAPKIPAAGIKPLGL
ncbi:hypothetical protein HY797_02295 [Candidatus Falkowbacteria bacterium]|nr:hypothetical protein [Candidatus Falkowbacteria bacterium]